MFFIKSIIRTRLILVLFFLITETLTYFATSYGTTMAPSSESLQASCSNVLTRLLTGPVTSRRRGQVGTEHQWRNYRPRRPRNAGGGPEG